jgi:hypothetical protein
MKAEHSSETSIDFQHTMRRYIPEHGILYDYRRENLRSNRVLSITLGPIKGDATEGHWNARSKEFHNGHPLSNIKSKVK